MHRKDYLRAIIGLPQTMLVDQLPDQNYLRMLVSIAATQKKVLATINHIEFAGLQIEERSILFVISWACQFARIQAWLLINYRN